MSNEIAAIEIFFSGDEYYLRLLEEIQNAKSQILFEVYIFEMDELGQHLFHALARASQRGVKVRLLVDGVGSSNSWQRLIYDCRREGISFRAYHPPFFYWNSWRGVTGWRFRNLWRPFLRSNKRDHRKIIMIDRRRFFLGSFNITKKHSERLMGTKAYRDTGVFVELPVDDPDGLALIAAHEEAWRSSRNFNAANWRAFVKRKRARLNVQRLFRLNNSPTQRFFLLRDLNRRLKKAESAIWITNAYFIPRKSILRNLRRAARRGVDVRILLPEKNDVWIVQEASRSLYLRLLKSGVRIFQYQKSMLHAKSLLIDDWGTVGSHNLNHRSLMHDLEAEIVIDNLILLQKLRHQWTLDLAQAHEVKLDELSRDSLWRKALARVLYWFRFWL